MDGEWNFLKIQTVAISATFPEWLAFHLKTLQRSPQAKNPLNIMD